MAEGTRNDGGIMAQELSVEVAQLLLADRTTLQNFEQCPAQAKFVADGRVITSSHATDVGNAIHDAMGEVVTEYVNSRGNMSVTDLVELGTQLLCASRPDVQGDAIQAMRPSLWSWAKYVSGIHHDNILRYDGGEKDRCGQLAWDIEDLKVRVTSEIDFLHTGKATEVLTEIDLKSGRKYFTSQSVQDSFQFAMHAWLALENYPDVKCVEIRVWNTRMNNLTYSVRWERRDLYELQYRMRSSVMNWLRYRDKPAEECPTWPTQEKCAWCAAAALCPAVPADIQKLTADPEGLVELMVATEAKLKALAEIATGHVQATGKDIVTSSGAAFGIGKPKKQTKAKTALYKVISQSEDEEE